MMAGAGRSIGSQPIRDDGPLPVERAAERIDDAAEQCRPHRHPHDIARAVHGIASLDRIHIVKQDAADPAALEHLGEAELSLVERSNSSSRTVGSPEISAIPSPTSSTRPICSVCGPRDMAPSFARACPNQTSAGSSGSFVMRKVRKNPGEIGAPTVGNDEVRAAQFKAGDQRGIHLEVDLRTNSERLADQFR